MYAAITLTQNTAPTLLSSLFFLHFQRQTTIFPAIFVLHYLTVSGFGQITFLLILELSSGLYCITTTLLILTFKTPHNSSHAVQAISSTYLSFPWFVSTETSCLFYPSLCSKNTDRIPWATQPHISLPEVSSLRQTIFTASALSFLKSIYIT